MNEDEPKRANEETITVGDEHHSYSTRKPLTSVVLVTAVTGAMMINVASMASTIVALPTIVADLKIPSNKVQWLISGFSLSAGCLLLLCGRLADLFGRRTVFILGSIWFAIFALSCGFAQSAEVLIVLQALGGFGPAATLPAGLGILAQSFPPSKERSRAFATFAAGAPLGAALAQGFAGPVVQYTSASWRGVFWILSGMSCLVALLGWLTIDADRKRPDGDKRVDWIGALLVTSGLVLITFALAEANSAKPSGWASPQIVVCLVVGPLFILAFFLWERHLQNNTDFPLLMPPQIWTRAHGRVAAILTVTMCVYASFQSLYYWATLYYQDYTHLSPTQTMLRFLPMPCFGIVATFIIAQLVGNVNGALLLMFGEASTAMGSLLLAIIEPDAPYWQYGFPSATLSVFGADFSFAAGTLYIAKVSHPSEQSVASALFQTMQQLGVAIGLAVTTITQTYATQKEEMRLTESGASPSVVRDNSMLKGFRVAQWTSCGFAVLALLITVLFLRDIGMVGDKKKKVIDETDEIERHSLPDPVERARHENDIKYFHIE